MARIQARSRMAATDADARAFEEGCRLLEGGLGFEAHEVWEELWLRRGGACARYLQGLIQLAVALHHWQAGRHGPARRLLARARAKLETPGTAGEPEWPAAAAFLGWADAVFAPLADRDARPQAPGAVPPVPR